MKTTNTCRVMCFWATLGGLGIALVLGCGSKAGGALETDTTGEGSEGATSTSDGGGGDASSGGSASGDTGGDTGGPPPTDEGRCPGWTEQVLAEACAVAAAGEVFDAEYMPGFWGFRSQIEFGGAGRLYRVRLSDVPEGSRDGAVGIFLRLDFTNGVQKDLYAATAVFQVDNDLVAYRPSNIGNRFAPSIDVSSCEELRSGQAFDPTWPIESGEDPADRIFVNLSPKVAEGQDPQDFIPWDQDVHFVVVTRPPECMGASEPPGGAGQVPRSPEAGERIGGGTAEEPGPCGGG